MRIIADLTTAVGLGRFYDCSTSLVFSALALPSAHVVQCFSFSSAQLQFLVNEE